MLDIISVFNFKFGLYEGRHWRAGGYEHATIGRVAKLQVAGSIDGNCRGDKISHNVCCADVYGIVITVRSCVMYCMKCISIYVCLYMSAHVYS